MLESKAGFDSTEFLGRRMVFSFVGSYDNRPDVYWSIRRLLLALSLSIRSADFPELVDFWSCAPLAAESMALRDKAKPFLQGSRAVFESLFLPRIGEKGWRIGRLK